MNSRAAFRLWTLQPAHSKRAACCCAKFTTPLRHARSLLSKAHSAGAYVNLFRQARNVGYSIELHYLWLASPAQAIARVRQRVRNGGHNVPVADIRRRFERSLKHLLSDYLPLAMQWTIWDNRGTTPKFLASSLSHDIDMVRRLVSV